MRKAMKKGTDKKVFRRTATKTRAINIYGFNSRGGLRK